MGHCLNHNFQIEGLNCCCLDTFAFTYFMYRFVLGSKFNFVRPISSSRSDGCVVPVGTSVDTGVHNPHGYTLNYNGEK